MKYQVQKQRVYDGPSVAFEDPRLQSQLNELRAGSAELAQTAKKLQADMKEFRTTVTTLNQRVDTFQADVTAFRKELSEAAGCILQFHAHLETTAGAMREATTALSAATASLAEEQQRERQHQAAVIAELQGQRAEQKNLTTAVSENRQRVCERLEQLARQETQLQQTAAEAAAALAESLQKLDRQARERMDSLCASVQRLADEEQASLGQMAGGFQQVLECEQSLSTLLTGVNATLANLAHHSEQVLIEDRRTRADYLLGEAARLNSLGLKGLADGRPEAAARHFERARQCAPEAFEPAFNLAIAQLRQDQPAAARQIADELLAAFPARAEVHFLRGVVSLASRNFDDAQRHLGRFAESGAQNESMLAAAGLAHLLNGDARAATTALRRAAGSAHPDAQCLREIGFEAMAPDLPPP